MSVQRVVTRRLFCVQFTLFMKLINLFYDLKRKKTLFVIGDVCGGT